MIQKMVHVHLHCTRVHVHCTFNKASTHTVHVHNIYIVYMYNVLHTIRKLCTNCVPCTCVIFLYLQYMYSVHAIIAKYYDRTTVAKYYDCTVKLNTTKQVRSTGVCSHRNMAVLWLQYGSVYDCTTITKWKCFWHLLYMYMGVAITISVFYVVCSLALGITQVQGTLLQVQGTLLPIKA